MLCHSVPDNCDWMFCVFVNNKNLAKKWPELRWVWLSSFSWSIIWTFSHPKIVFVAQSGQLLPHCLSLCASTSLTPNKQETSFLVRPWGMQNEEVQSSAGLFQLARWNPCERWQLRMMMDAPDFCILDPNQWWGGGRFRSHWSHVPLPQPGVRRLFFPSSGLWAKPNSLSGDV